MGGTLHPLIAMKTAPKILLGGVPFGRNNVGDEAILECIVKIVRKICPRAEITVSTDDPEATREKLRVKTIQLFGFTPPFSQQLLKQTMRENDLFIWSGATGLSDYPEQAAALLEAAQQAGTRTALFGVGMNDQLNPSLFTLFPGCRHTLYSMIEFGLGGTVNLMANFEEKRKKSARKKLQQTLARADLIALRDPESRAVLSQCGEIPNVTVGADAALQLVPGTLAAINLPDATRRLLQSDVQKIGICVSAQREIQEVDQFIHYLDRWVADNRRRIVFVPMNPITDSTLMDQLRQRMKYGDRTVLIEGRYEPHEILTIAAHLDVVASSRLHLLILASIAHVPIIGISRGSKVDNFLKPFGLQSVGSVEACDFKQLDREVIRLLRDRQSFEQTSRAVRRDLLQRLDRATEQLRQLIRAL